MKRALVVAYYFPPIAASGSLRPLGFCRYLEQHGWLPRVLTTDPDSVYPPHGVDENLRAKLPRTLQIDVVPYTNPFQALLRARDRVRERVLGLLYDRSHQRLVNNHLMDRAGMEPRGQLSALKDLVLDWAFSFPDPQCSWLRPAIRRLSKLAREESPDVVFATGGPWTGLLVGKALAEHFGVPYVADFRDPWTSNPYCQYSSPFLVRKAKRLERSVCASAARVVTNTEELGMKFRAEYPELGDRCITITNGFDNDGCMGVGSAGNDGDHLQPLHTDGQMLELFHFGTVYGKRNPFPLLQAIAELFGENQIRSDQLRVRFIGVWEANEDRCERLAQELEKHGFLRREAPVPHQLCLQQMARAKALLVLQPDSPLQIPGKIYEYIATGRPLLLIGGEGATARTVEQHRLGKHCPNRVSDIKALLAQLAVGQLQIEPSLPANIARFDYRNLSGELAKVFDGACLERARRS